MSYLKIKDVTKSYDNKVNVIKRLNLSVEEGEFLVIVGPTGCGKSTILRMIAGLEEVDGGQIIIDNKIVNNIPPADRDIAMVFQNYALYPHMSVEKNLSYPLKNRKVPKDIIKSKVQAVAKLLQIEELLKRKPNELSGGQKQRVAIGRAIIREPKVFLFDEPLSNLDAKLRQQLRLEIKKLHKRLKITSVYVTHDQIEAMTLADRIAVMNNGIIEQVGTPEEIYNDPQTLFVAKFMGTPPMNIFKCQVTNGKIDLFGNQIKLSTNVDDEEVYLGIRPEDISLNEGKEIKLSANVETIEKLGSENLIYATTLDGYELVVKTNNHVNKSLSSVNVYIDIKSIHLFDKHGKRII